MNEGKDYTRRIIDNAVREDRKDIGYLEDELELIDVDDLSYFYKERENNIFNIFLTSKSHHLLLQMLNRAMLNQNYRYGVSLLSAVVCNPNLQEYQKIIIIKKMIILGCSINWKDKNKETALYQATKRGLREVAIFLLENGGNPNIGNDFNITPLMISGYNDMIYLSSLLIYFGADINAKTKVNNLSVKDIIRESIGFNVENLMTEFKS